MDTSALLAEYEQDFDLYSELTAKIDTLVNPPPRCRLPCCRQDMIVCQPKR